MSVIITSGSCHHS